jgi:hypothetical protein
MTETATAQLVCPVCGTTKTHAGKPFKNKASLSAHIKWHDTMTAVGRDEAPKELAAKRAKGAAATEEKVKNFFVPVQIGLIGSGDLYCAKAVGEDIPAIAKALGELGEDFPLLKQVVDLTDKWGAISQLAYHGARLAAAIGVHHEWLPYEGPIKFLIPPPPQVIEANPLLKAHYSGQQPPPTAPQQPLGTVVNGAHADAPAA